MNKPPAFQFYAKDWLADTARLTLELEGAYVRLLCHQWNEGPLPDVPAELMEILGVTRQKFTRMWARLSRYFPAWESGTVANVRMEDERQKQAEYRRRQSDRGRTSAQRRLNPGPSTVGADDEPEGYHDMSGLPVNDEPEQHSASASASTGKSTTKSALRAVRVS